MKKDYINKTNISYLLMFCLLIYISYSFIILVILINEKFPQNGKIILSYGIKISFEKINKIF